MARTAASARRPPPKRERRERAVRKFAAILWRWGGFGRGPWRRGPLGGCVVDSEVDSVSSFLKAWLAATLLIIGYAWLDLRFNPHLSYETSFTLTPDVARLSDLWDWGGRLLHHGAVGLLALNAIALGGITAIVVKGALGAVRRLRAPLDAPRVSIVPASVPTSVPPPAP